MTSRLSLAARTRFYYLLISLVTVTVLMVIVFFIANGIANDASRRIARQYSIEAAGNFQAHLNPHLMLMNQLARSTTIGRWLADDMNEGLKDLAFDDVVGFAKYMPTSRFMLTAYDTLNIYDFLPGMAETLTRETFVSLGQLIPGEEAMWFFNTRDDALFFNLNIQREMAVQDLDPDTLQMWANQRVYYEGAFVGVVAIGIPFRYIFAPTFGAFEAGEMRGYIIDRDGGVRVDSAELLDVFDDGLPTFPQVPEALDNPEFLTQINRHLAQRVDGVYQLGAYTFEAVRLHRGDYSFASIAPIIGLDWSVVVLSYQAGIFDFQYVPLVYAVIMVTVLSMLAINMVIRRIIITPLVQLTASAANVEVADESAFFGINRQDEIGDLARTIYWAQVTRKKMLEEAQKLEVAEASNKAKGEFLARMSHEIRTPISAVLGISEIAMLTPGLPPIAEDSFTKIHTSGKLLLGLINDILDFSKIEGGKMTLTTDPYATTSLIYNAANLHYAYLNNKAITFNLHVDENLPASLIGDVLRIEQIILNILSNAFKYTNEGSVNLSLACAPLKDGFITLEISIRDTGLGMTSEQLTVIFEDYTRFHEREKSGISGTGLGMSIVSNLLKMMDAQIDLQSEVGKGTTVTVRIPQEIANPQTLGKEVAAQLQQFEIKESDTRRSFEPMPYGRVLVVDDIDTNLYVAQRLLAFYQLDIHTAQSGYDAIERIKQGETYDIIFMDHMMPGLDGIAAMHQLRQLHYQAPIIILTANALAGQEKEYIAAGFDAFLSKPVITEKLDVILHEFIHAKQPPEVIEAARNAAQPAYLNDPLEVEKLRINFAKNHKNLFADLQHTLHTNAAEAAHLVAHTLKGLAALINEPTLSNYAQAVETAIANQETPNPATLRALEAEFNRVLHSVSTLGPALDTLQALALLDDLIPLLEERDSESLQLLNDLRALPETAILVRQIEKLGFRAALESAKTLRSIWEEA